MKRSNLSHYILKFFIIGLFAIFSILGGANAIDIPMGTAWAASISGTIYDSSQPPSPLPSVGVQLFTPEGQWLSELNSCSGSTGFFTIANIPAGKYILLAGGWTCAPGTVYAQTFYSEDGNGNFIGTYDPHLALVFNLNATDNITGKNFYLAKGATISGSVTVSEGTGPGNVNVSVYGTYWGYGRCTDSSENYLVEGLPPGTYRVSAGGPNFCGGQAYKQVFYNNKPDWNSADLITLSLGETRTGINFSNLMLDAAISGTITGDPNIGIRNINVVLHDSLGRLVDFQTVWDYYSGSYYFRNLTPGETYTIKVYDPFLNYKYVERSGLLVSSGNLTTADFTLENYAPSGVNSPTFKSRPMAFILNNPDGTETLILQIEVEDPSGCQPASIKSVTAMGPDGTFHYLYHQKYQVLIDLGLPNGEFWWTAGDNEFDDMSTQVGDFTITVLDVEGNRATATANLGSYSKYKLAIPALNDPADLDANTPGIQVDPNNLTLSWNSVANAAVYQVRIMYLGERIWKSGLISGTLLTIPTGILSEGRWYSWNIIAFDNATPDQFDYASLSETRSFFTLSGTTPPSEPLNVRIVPWVPISPLVPHDAYAGHQTTLKAVAKGGTPPYTYTWDFGDGSPFSTTTTSNPYNLEAFHQYSASSDTFYDAKITVTDNSGATVSGVYPIRFWFTPSRTVQVNVAIDDALWWLHKNMSRFTSGGTDYGLLDPSYPAGNTAVALHAWVLNGHRPDGDPNNPYVEDTIRAKNYILSQLHPICIGPETVAGVTRNPDSNGNGIGLYVKNGERMYETGLVLMALATLEDPSLTNTIQDLIDYLAYAQVEPDAGGGRGGWRYDANYRESDMSVTQFPLMGLEAAEYHLGSSVTIPPYIKEELKNNFLYFVQNKESGGFGYSWPDNWVNVAKTGAGLVGLALTGIPYNDPRATMALNFINNQWSTAVEDYYNIGDFYAMYAVMKGMKSYAMKGYNTTLIGSHDWYNEYALWEIQNQNSNGYWESPVNSYGRFIDTSFGVLILLPQIFAIGPTAVAQASPTTVQVGDPVTFNHSGSFHRDSTKTIVLYQWDFNGDGVFEWSTTNRTETHQYIYSSAGSYTATLQITDNEGLKDTDQITIDVTMNQYILTVNVVGSGSVTISPNKSTYLYGDIVTLTAVANIGYTFSGWSGDVSGINNPITITMDGNKTVTATFDFTTGISGRVTDASGNGIANVNVKAADPNVGWWVGDTTSDGQGYYTIFVTSGSYRVLFDPSGASGYYAPEWYNNKSNYEEADSVTVNMGQITSNINAQLEVGGKISGRVTDASGNGIANIFTFASDLNDNFINGTFTDNQGYYTFSVPAGTYKVAFDPWPYDQPYDGYYLEEYYDNKRRFGEADSVTVTAGQTTSNINAQLDVGGRISGRVTDASGNGISNVEVWGSDNYGRWKSNTYSDSQGYYAFSIAAGTYWVGFDPSESPGYYAPEWYDNKRNLNEANSVTVVTEQTTSNINAQLEVGGKISGRVTDVSGNGIANVDIDFENLNGNWWEGTGSDHQGYYTISVAEGTYKIIFNPRDVPEYYAPEWYDNKSNRSEANQVIVTAGQTTNINAQLEVGGKISGRVTDPSGNGIPNVEVWAEDLNGNWMGGSVFITNSQGYYTFPVAPGTYKVGFDPWAYGEEYLREWYNDKRNSGEADLVTVTAGQTTSNINAQLEVGGKISGRVTDSFGNGLADISVDPVDFYNNWPGGTWTDSEGNYTVSVASGTYKVHFYLQGWDDRYYAPEWYNNKPNTNEADFVTVIAGQTTSNIDAQLEVGGKISGKVTDSSGNGLGNVRVRAHDLNNVWIRGEPTDSEGHYRIAVAPGNYKVIFDPYDVGNYATEWYNNKENFSQADIVTVTAEQTTRDINAQLSPQRRLEWCGLYVYNGKLVGEFSIYPGFRNLIKSATLTGPNGFSYQFDIANIPPTNRSSECRYLTSWSHLFDSAFNYGAYTLTLNYYDGVTETYTKNLQEAHPLPVETFSDTLQSDGGADINWVLPTTSDQYYRVRVRSVDGKTEYYASSYMLNTNAIHLSAPDLRCLEKDQTYSWLFDVYDTNPTYLDWGVVVNNSIERTTYPSSVYNPELSGLRTTSYSAISWGGRLSLYFDVRPGSRDQVTKATVTGPGNFSYQFDLTNDFVDLTTDLRANKAWYEQFDHSPAFGDYIFKIEYSDGHVDTITKSLQDIPITPVSSASMSSEIHPNGAITFRWEIPLASPEPVTNQYYVLRIRSANGTKEYYGSARMLDRNNLFLSYYDLRGLEHCKTYQWQVRAYDQPNDQNSNTVQFSGNKTFFYNPFGLDCYTLTVTKDGDGTGKVTSSPEGINCGSDCTEKYVGGSPVTLTATPDAGSTFTGWSGACTGTGSCTLTMFSPQDVSAGFTLTNPAPTVVSSSANPSTYGQSVTFTATVTPSAASGTVTFKDGTTTIGIVMLSGGQATFSTSSLSVGPHSVTAEYAGDSNYNGSTSPVLTQTVNPTPGYTVATNPPGLHVVVDGATYAGPQTFTWVVGSSHTISAPSPQSGGTGAQYVFLSWSDGGSQGHTISAPSSSTTYTANFTTQNGLTTSVYPPEGGTVMPSGVNWYNSGQTVPVLATPSSGYTFSSWSGDLSGSSNPAFVIMSGPKNVTANFSVEVVPCNYSIFPTSQNFGKEGGIVSISITTGNVCQWRAWSNASWITMTSGGSGIGSSAVSYSVAANTGPARTGTLTIAGETFTVNQTSGCTYLISPTSTSSPSSGGTGYTISVTAGAGCAWTATSNAPWITINSGGSGTGNGTVSYSVAANTGPARDGTMTIAGQTVTIHQESGCTYGIDSTSAEVPSGVNTGSIGVKAGNGCQWTAASNVSWITITSGVSGVGNGTVNYSVEANTGPKRDGMLTIAGQTFTVHQAAGCDLAVNPTYASYASSGGTNTVIVTAPSSTCTWEATSNDSWITIKSVESAGGKSSGRAGKKINVSGASYSGSGKVTYSVEANTGPARDGTMTIAGQTVTIHQESGCTYGIDSTSAEVPSGGSTGSVGVTAGNGCQWTAVSNVLWISITSGASGTGSGGVNYSVAANTGPARDGTITIAGQTFTVHQAAAIYNLTVNITGNGTLRFDPPPPFPAGTKVTVYFEPADGFDILDIIVDGVSMKAVFPMWPVYTLTFRDFSENHTINIIFG